VFVERFLNLSGIDVLATANYHIFLTVDNVNIPLRILSDKVAAVEPASSHGFSLGFGVFVVLLHYCGTSIYCLTHSVYGYIIVVIVNNSHFYTRDNPSYGYLVPFRFTGRKT